MTKSLFTILLAFSASIMAQAEDKVVLTEKYTQQVSTIDGSLNDLYRTLYRYDREGRQIEWVQYNLASGGGYNGGAFNLYDEAGVHIGDSTSSAKWLYIRDTDGRIVRKEKYAADINGEFVLNGYLDIHYDAEGRTLAEVNKTTTLQIADSTVYIYDNNALSSLDTYTRVSKDGYGVTKRTRYTYNAMGKKTRELTMSVYNGYESVTKGVGYSYDLIGRLATDTILGNDADPRYLTIYKYDGDDTRSAGDEYYRLNNDQWMKSEVRTNSYSTISAERTPTLISATQSVANGPVSISVQAPSLAEGYQGYKVIVDHQVRGGLQTAGNTEMALSRGMHEIRVIAVYDGKDANVSNAIKTAVSHSLPQVTNVKVRTMEYKYSWTVTLGWTAPEAGDMHLTGYRISYPTPWGYDNETSAKTTKATFSYSGKDNIVVKVYAVYSEGTSDPVEFALDLTDTGNMVTEHWHNVLMNQTVGEAEAASEHYYYLDNNSNLTRPELLSTTIAFDAAGNPLTRLVADHMENNYAKLLSETIDKWNDKTKSWDRYRQVEYAYNEINQVGKKLTKEFSPVTHTYETIATEESTYDDAISGTQPATTSFYTLNGNEKTLTEYRTFIHEMDAIGINRIETATVHDATGTATKTVKTFKHATTGSEVHVDSVLTYDYASQALIQREVVEIDPESGLDAAYVTYDGTGTVIARKEYTASKEYHATHNATDLFFFDGKLTWTAPSRTKGLEGYRILINDVEMATVGLVTEYDVDVNIPTGMYDFAVVPVYDGAEAAVSASTMGEYEAPESGIKAMPSKESVNGTATYDLLGRRTSATMSGRIYIKGGHAVKD